MRAVQRGQLVVGDGAVDPAGERLDLVTAGELVAHTANSRLASPRTAIRACSAGDLALGVADEALDLAHRRVSWSATRSATCSCWLKLQAQLNQGAAQLGDLAGTALVSLWSWAT